MAVRLAPSNHPYGVQGFPTLLLLLRLLELPKKAFAAHIPAQVHPLGVEQTLGVVDQQLRVVVADPLAWGILRDGVAGAGFGVLRVWLAVRVRLLAWLLGVEPFCR